MPSLRGCGSPRSNDRAEKHSIRRRSSRTDFMDSSRSSGSISKGDSERKWDSVLGSDSTSATSQGSSYATPYSDSVELKIKYLCDLPDRSEKTSNDPKSIRHNPNSSPVARAAAPKPQRRKKESLKLRASIEKNKVREVNCDVSPTRLYQFITKTMWKEAAELCKISPVDAKTWVYRNQKKGGALMWRMLPIHIAVLYRAPVYFLFDLLDANPDGTSEPDDRNMLPIHMACHIICKEDVLRLLLKHNPLSLNAEDIMGRTPLKFLQDKREDESQSRMLQKVNARNRTQLIVVLKECTWQIEEVRKKTPNSVCPKAGGYPLVKVRKKKISNFDRSGGRMSDERRVVSIDRIATRNPSPSREYILPKRTSFVSCLSDIYSDNQAKQVCSRSNSRNSRVGNDYIYRSSVSPHRRPPQSNRTKNNQSKIACSNSRIGRVGDDHTNRKTTSSVASPHKLSPQSNRPKNNERKGRYSCADDTELVSDKYRNSSLPSNREDRKGEIYENYVNRTPLSIPRPLSRSRRIKPMGVMQQRSTEG